MIENWQKIRDLETVEKDLRPNPGKGNVFVDRKTAEKAADYLKDYRDRLAGENPDVGCRPAPRAVFVHTALTVADAEAFARLPHVGPVKK